MALTKNDKTVDAITDLYRAAYYLALESKETGLNFLRKAKEKLGGKLNLDVDKIVKQSGQNYLYWAEKILDEHKRLKISLSSN
jgi:hypothetical protein